MLVWDDELKGFGLRITDSSVSFIYNYRTRSGRPRRLTIGSPPTYSVEAARDEAKDYAVEVRKGRDPLAHHQAERDAPTFADLAEFYVEKHLPKKRPSSAKIDRQTIDAELLPVLGQLKVAEITYDDIDGLHRRITKRAPYRANRVVALLSKMFSLAIRKRWRRQRQPGQGHRAEPGEQARAVSLQ